MASPDGKMNPNQGKVQTPYGPGNPTAPAKTSTSQQFSKHPGHGSAKKTIAGESNG